MFSRNYRGVGCLVPIAIAYCLAGSICTGGEEDDLARRILAGTGVRGGLIVHVGCDGGKLTAALGAGGAHLVQGVDTDAEQIVAARQYLLSKGLYGRVSAETFDGEHLPYVDNLINLLVISDAECRVSGEELERVLAPRGVAIWPAGVSRMLEPVSLVGDDYAAFTKPVPEELDEWTHYLYDPGGNAVSKDRLAGPSRHVKWVAGPLWSRSHEYTPSMAAMVSSGGRIIAIHDDGIRGITDPRIGDRWVVQARDAANGLLLWKRPMSPGWSTAAWAGSGNWSTPMALPRRLVARGERVYLTLGYRSPVTVLDAATGEVVRELDKTQNTDEMVLTGNTLLVRRRKSIPNYSPEASAWKVQRKPTQEPPDAEPGDETIAAVDVVSGKTLWQWSDARVVTLSLAAHRGRTCYHNFEELVCLDLATGKLLWRAACPCWPDLVETSGTLVMYEDIVLYAADRGLHAFSAADGKLLWKGPRIARTGIRHAADLQIADGLVWAGITPQMPTGTIPKEVSPFAVPAYSGTDLLGLDPKTGEVKRRVDVGHLMSAGHHIRCYRSKGTERYLMWPKRGTEFVDIVGGKDHAKSDWLRGECSYGVMPAGGLLFVPPHPCICSTGVKLQGFFATAAVPVVPSKAGTGVSFGHGGHDQPRSSTGRNLRPPEEQARLHHGPAYAMETVAEPARPSDWPMYRHDAARSGSTPTTIPPKLKTAWKADVGGRLTQCVVAGGKVLVASVDAHTLHALDAGEGHPLWSFVAGGRIDSAPTATEGRVLFGSRDGWVYCLRTGDGALAWRYRAAPVEARLTAFSRLESPWPVFGSVLVHDGVAYVAAGRSSFLDGGMVLYGLDVKTGTVIHRRHLEGPRPDIAEGVGQPYAMRGAKPDLFTFNGTSLSMGPREFKLDLIDHREFAPQGAENWTTSGAHLRSGSGLLDYTWHDRTFWTHGRAWPGRNVFQSAHIAPKTGQILVFDESTVYALKVFFHRHRMSPKHVPGGGYALIADAIDNEPGRNFRRAAPPKWKTLVPLRARGLVLASDRLFLAGCRDVIPEDDPTAVYEGRTPVLLWAVSTCDGRRIAEQELDAPPVCDGMSAAGGRLYISGIDGMVTCLTGQGAD